MLHGKKTSFLTTSHSASSESLSSMGGSQMHVIPEIKKPNLLSPQAKATDLLVSDFDANKIKPRARHSEH